MVESIKRFLKLNEAKLKSGFGIAEVLVAAAVLGFFCVALNRLQLGNHDALLRIRGRDGAVEVAQQVMDVLKAAGAAEIPSAASTAKDTTYTLSKIERSWPRSEKMGGDSIRVWYTPTVTVYRTSDYLAENSSNYETIQHVYAKRVNVKIEWAFKGSTQSINVTGVVR